MFEAISIKEILIQLVGLVPSVIAFTSLQCDNRSRILKLMILCCTLWGLQYALLGAYTGILINVIGIFRAIICRYNDRAWARSRFWLAALIIAYPASSLLTWNGFVSLLPACSMVLTTIALWTHNMRATRLLFALNSPTLFLYNVLVGSWSCAAIEVCAFISYVIAVWRYDIRPAKKLPDLSR